MESLPYYDYIILCKQINPSNPERPKPLRFLHHLWGHQCTKESSEACPHERISSDTDTNTEEKGVNLTGIFESKSWPALTRTSPTASSNRSEALSAQEKAKRERKRKNEQKRKWKKVDIYLSFPCRRTIKHDTYNYRAQIFKQNRVKTTLISVTKI